MRCEKNFITIKSIWHNYLVLSLNNCAYEISTETGLTRPDKLVGPSFVRIDQTN